MTKELIPTAQEAYNKVVNALQINLKEYIEDVVVPRINGAIDNYSYITDIENCPMLYSRDLKEYLEERGYDVELDYTDCDFDCVKVIIRWDSV